MKPKEYPLMQECVERGVASGFRAAHKYTDTPSESVVLACIAESVMQAICESWEFEERTE